MAENVLRVNEPRIGWYYDGLPDEVSPPTATLLQDDGTSITLRLPIRPGLAESVGAVVRWFYGGAVRFSDDPDRIRFQYEPPEALLFHDPDGIVALLGCRSLGLRSNPLGASEGKLRVDLAVLGATTVEYERPHRVRTYIPGMGRWTGMSSVTSRPVERDDGRVDYLEVHADHPEPLELGPGLTLSTSWTAVHRDKENEVHISDPPYVETEFKDPTGFREHLHAHTRFRDLVDLAYWLPTGYRLMQFCRDDDDTPHGSQQWREVRTYSFRQQSEAHNTLPMFVLDQIGARGYQRWVQVHQKYRRAINPLMALLDIVDSNVEAQFIQSCIGLEGLGAQLARDSGTSLEISSGVGVDGRVAN